MKKKRFILSFSLGLFGLALSFFVSNNANAAITLGSVATTTEAVNKYQNNPYMYYMLDNTGCTDSILLVAWSANSSTLNVGDYNGDAITIVSDNVTVNGNHIGWGYLKNPDVGNYQINLLPTNWSAFTMIAAVMCGVDQTDPFVDTSSVSSDYQGATFNATGLTAGDALVSWQSRSDGTGSYNPTLTGGTIFGKSTWSATVYGGYAVATTTTALNSWYFSGDTYFNGYSVSLRQAAAAPSGLTIVINDFDAATQQLNLYGLCNQVGSGINQMRIVGLADDATTTQPVLPDPLGLWRGSLVDCNGSYNAHYDGSGLMGTHWVAVDDTFLGSQWVTWGQDFNATTTPDWAFSYGYMSQDDPTGTAHNLACTSEEWGTADPVIGIDWLSATTSLPTLNFKKIKCRLIEQYYIAQFSLRDQVKTAGQSFITATGNMFPFNFSTAIDNAWLQSASSTLPTALSFLDSEDSSGNIKIPVSQSLSGNTTTTVTIFGNDIFRNSTTTIQTFDSVKAVSTWLIRLLIFALMITLGSKIYHEFNGTKV